MSTGLRVATAVLLLLLPAATSCRWFRKTKPPVPRPAQIPMQTEPAKPAPPPPLEPPPRIPTAEPTAGGIPGEEPLPLPPPPVEKKRPSPAGPRVPATTEPTAAPPAVPAPQLRPMLTPAQRQELERSVNERIRRTRGILASIGARSLSGNLGDLARQIRTFLNQAEEARGTDLLRANNLAERAEVLAEDLAKRLR